MKVGRPNSLPRILVLMSLVLSICIVQVAVTDAASKVTQVRIWGLNVAVPGGAREIVEEFNRTHKDIQVVPEVPTLVEGGGTQAGTMTTMQKLLTAIAGGNPPDITTIDKFSIPSWVARGALQPLTSFAKQENYDFSDFYTFAIDEARFDGELYALPNQSVDGRYLFYNKSLFKRAGLDPNKPPKTWEELVAYGKKLTHKKASGEFETMGYLSLLAPPGTLYLYAILNGGRFISEDGKTALLNSREVVEALEWMVDWYDEMGGAEQVSAFTGTFEVGSPNDPFLTGRLAQMVHGDWSVATIARYNPSLEFGVVPVPTPKGKEKYYGTTWFGGWGYAIPKGAKNAKAAWEVIKWFASKEGYLAFAKGDYDYMTSIKVPFVPQATPRKSATAALDEKYTSLLGNNFKTTVVFLRRFVTDHSRTREKSPVASQIYDEAGRAFESAIHHKATPEQALNVAQERLQKVLDDFYKKKK
ncbi:MAG TPA: ABC transporter substrate-binding protein [Firmicutes bacterium]|nr:ABC transporter substrate-binding protein [Bacillota bacterium]